MDTKTALLLLAGVGLLVWAGRRRGSIGSLTGSETSAGPRPQDAERPITVSFGEGEATHIPEYAFKDGERPGDASY